MALELNRDGSREYSLEHLDRIAFPLGGIGAGMICIEGSGYISHQSLHHAPDVEREMDMFGAICLDTDQGKVARVLQGQVPKWRRFKLTGGTGNGSSGRSYGLPRFRECEFESRFPFAKVQLRDPSIPLDCAVTAWSPFVPNDADSSSLPVAALEYEFTNSGSDTVSAVFSFHLRNPMVRDRFGESGAVGRIDDGLIFSGRMDPKQKSTEGWLAAVCTGETDLAVDPSWFRGGAFDSLTMVWQNIAAGRVVSAHPLSEGDPSPGGSLYLPISLKPGESRTVGIDIVWFVPGSDLRTGPEEKDCGGSESCCCEEKTDRPAYQPWYAGRFASLSDITTFWTTNRQKLRDASERFSRALYGTSLPPEIVEAAAANLTILKSPTVLRQRDGRMWAWEGCSDSAGCCAGSCTHVWNYAQAIPHLFPDLERSLRHTEFFDAQDETGHQGFRAPLPIRDLVDHDFHAAADGQLGGIMKVFRDWRISGDIEWLREYWPRLETSLEYCIRSWDPDLEGVLREPHHNTYDIEFWGPDGMCTSFYLGALKAAAMMAGELGNDGARYQDLYEKGRIFMEKELFDGEYFIQEIQWKGLKAGNPADQEAFFRKYSAEARELMEKEGPKYQYGRGCLSDGVLGAWLAEVCGVGEILDPEKVRSHLLAVHRYNLKRDLTDYPNPQRPSYAMGDEGGLLLCSWPKGGELSLPFIYSNEVWTGIEYQVAGHLMMLGCVDEGIEIVRVCRDRYDGSIRNPFNEYECGHWYARAMASYGLFQALSGARYDAVEKVLHLHPNVQGDFTSFLSTATGYGLVGIRKGEAFIEVVAGSIPVERIEI